MLKTVLFPTLLLSFVAAICPSPSAFAQEPHHGPGPGGPPPPPDTPETAAIRARLGDTSTLMGSIAIPNATASCDGEAHYSRLLCLTELLVEDLDDETLSLLQSSYSLEKAKSWSNLPAGAFPSRPGVFLGELSIKQRGFVKAILLEAASQSPNEGFDEMVQTLNADDYIGTISTDYKAGYSSFNGKIAFLGEPSESGLWQLYYGGHHFAFSNTYNEGALVGATPSFRGIEPFPAFDMNGRENKPLTQERDAFATLLLSLSATQQEAAQLQGTYRDIIAGPQADNAIPDVQEGIPVTELTPSQQALLLDAIYTYVGDINHDEASFFMTKYKEELNQTVLGYSGDPNMVSENDYVRIHGPSLWIEFSLQSNKSTNTPGNHPHSVWRDIVRDYGGQQQ